MDPIEIKQRKKLVVPFLGFCILMMLISAGIGFFADKYKDDTRSKVSTIVGFILFAYLLYSPIKKLIKDQPIITLTDDSIILHMPKSVVIPKKNILEIEVTYVEETGYFLIIKTENKTHEENISWLDKTPDEIKELIKKYS